MRCNCSFSLIVGHVNKQMNKQSSLIHDGIIIIITVHHYTIDATELYTVTVHLLYRQDTLGYMRCFLCHSDIFTLSLPFPSIPFLSLLHLCKSKPIWSLIIHHTNSPDCPSLRGSLSFLLLHHPSWCPVY